MSTTSVPSKWDDREKFIYFFILKLKHADFEYYSTRKSAKVFDYLSHLINTRSREQVKSYHQRMMKKYKTIATFLDYYEDESRDQMVDLEKNYLTNKIKKVAKIHREREILRLNHIDSSTSIENMEIDSPVPEDMDDSKAGSATMEEIIEEDMSIGRDVIVIDDFELP